MQIVGGPANPNPLATLPGSPGANVLPAVDQVGPVVFQVGQVEGDKEHGRVIDDADGALAKLVRVVVPLVIEAF